MSVGGLPEALTYAPFAQTPALVEVLAGRRTVGVGDRGQHVKTIEEALVSLGYGLAGGETPDIAFSKGTQGAIMRFQRDRGIVQSGKIDRATLLALDSAAVQRRPGAVKPGKVDTAKLMRELLAEAASPGSDGGSRITLEEAKRALDALLLDDGKVSPEEYAAAKQQLEGEVFVRAAMPPAREFASQWLRQHAPSPGSATPFSVRKLDSAARDSILGGPNDLIRDTQAAEGKLSAPIPGGGPRLEAVLEDAALRAFGRSRTTSGFDLDPLRQSDPGAIAKRVGVGGLAALGSALGQRLAEIAGGSGKTFAGGWIDRRGARPEHGSFVAVLKGDGVSVLLLDVLHPTR